MRVAVVGAGIIGTSITVELAARGAEVDLIERSEPGSGTSAASYAWVNSNNKSPDSYYRLNLAGVEAHRELAGPGDDWIRFTGHVEFATEPDHRADLRQRIERLSRNGYPVELISPERARELVPDLIIGEDCDTIAYYADEAHLIPDRYIAGRLKEAERLGVRLRTQTSVTHFEPAGTGVRVGLSDGTELLVDRVISATGRWTNDVTGLADLPDLVLENTEPGDLTVGYLAITAPGHFALDRLVTSPQLNVRPTGDGRLLLQALDLDASADPQAVPSPATAVGREFASRLAALLADAADAQVEELLVGYRAMPRDTRSIIGTLPSCPWLYLVATHSGVTLAPLLGTGVAKEILGEVEPLFADFRPDRLLEGVTVGSMAAPRRPGEQ